MTGSRTLRRGSAGFAAVVFAAALLSTTILAATPVKAQAVTPTPWATFYAHENATMKRAGVYFANLQAALDAKDVARTATAARVLYTYAKREATWLTTHPPQACYKPWWGYTRNYWTQLREGSGDVLKAVLRVDPAYLESALVHLNKVKAYVSAMASHMPTC
jgi:hypothetical protein